MASLRAVAPRRQGEALSGCLDRCPQADSLGRLEVFSLDGTQAWWTGVPSPHLPSPQAVLRGLQPFQREGSLALHTQRCPLLCRDLQSCGLCWRLQGPRACPFGAPPG